MKKQFRKLTPAPTIKRAAKILRNPKASVAKKSVAGKILARQAKKIRKIQPAPKVGGISRYTAKRAAKAVLGKK